MERILLYIILKFVLLSSLYASDSTMYSKGLASTVKSDLNSSIKTGYRYYNVFSRFETNDWLISGAVVGGTGILMIFDDKFSDMLGKKSTNNINKDLWDIPTYYGEWKIASSASLGLYGYGLIFKDDEIRKTGKMLCEGMAYAGTLNILLKGLLARSRPYNNDGEHKYYGFQWHDPHNSFPSGHSLVAFTVSTIFAERFNRTYISIPLYSIAALTAISRVRNNQHWFSDVFFGSCLGFWTGLFVVKENTGEKNEASKIMLIPEINRISLIINFN